jgi:hypothetical protein
MRKRLKLALQGGLYPNIQCLKIKPKRKLSKCPYQNVSGEKLIISSGDKYEEQAKLLLHWA